ncbi:type II toxin-antitoxin system Phd/YefM family antitoxin [Thiotrichales bacterium 19S11-10]|nr:type II toxin-antitoxin system Phd/YefM family antitoxin [Thiotrichales bacterium 19S11-10]
MAKDKPVFITNKGKISHVLLTIKDYQKLTGRKENILDLLSMPKVSDIEFEIPMLGNKLFFS